MSNFYKLVYIKGISRFDTWKFNSKQEQYDYFDGLNGVKIDDYYPPYYTNSIRLEINDVDYTTETYNYVLLYFNNKYYCYFIDGIDYVNEGLYTLDLSLDTIQTFMFDVNFLNSTVDKASIKRWTKSGSKYLINREYKRENLSTEDFINDQYINYSENKRYYYLIKSTSMEFESGDPQILSKSRYNKNILTSGFYYSLLPVVYYDGVNADLQTSYINLYNNDAQLIGNFATTNLAITDVISSPYVVEVYFINEYFLRNYLFREITSSNVRTVENYTWLDQYNDIYFNDKCQLGIGKLNTGGGTTRVITFNEFEEIFNEISLSAFPLYVNKQKNIPFSAFYVPALLDENYIHIYYGEKANYTTYPLSKAQDVMFNCYSYYDIFTGERTYRISADGEVDDKYNTTIVSTSQETLELTNDPWKEYLSQNKATDTFGRALNPLNQLFNTEADWLGHGIANTDKRNYFLKSGGLSAKAIRGLANPIAESFKTIGAINMDVLNYEVQKSNLQHSPITEKQGNNYSNDIVNKSVDVVYFSEKVKDIYDVAQLLENFGYSVHYTFADTNLFDIGTRYYYNLVRTSNIKVDTKAGIISKELLSDFADRFSNGLRLWTYTSNEYITEGLKYDNVETDFIE